MGSSSKTSSTNLSRESTVNNVDNRLAEGDGSIGGNVNLNLSELNLKGGAGSSLGGDGGGGNLDIGITTTDYGALDAASQIADRSLTLASNAQKGAAASVSGAVNAVKSVAQNATRDEGARTTQLLIVAGAVLAIGVAVVIVRRKR